MKAKKILVVDDDDRISRLFADFTEVIIPFSKVLTANSLEDAIELIKEHQFYLVLCGTDIPSEQEGITIFRQFHCNDKNPENCHFPLFIACSGDEDNKKKWAAAFGDYCESARSRCVFLVKPIGLADLIETIAQLEDQLPP